MGGLPVSTPKINACAALLLEPGVAVGAEAGLFAAGGSVPNEKAGAAAGFAAVGAGVGVGDFAANFAPSAPKLNPLPAAAAGLISSV